MRVEQRSRRAPSITKLKLANNYEEVDIETALTMSGFGKFNIIMLILAFPASCTVVFETGCMAYVIASASKDLDLTPEHKAMLQSASFAGMIMSGTFWGFLSDTFGRKKLIVIGYFLLWILNFLAGAFPIISLMITFKFFSGFVFCGPHSIFTSYISEVFLKKRRDLAVLSLGTFNSLGLILQAGLAMVIIPAHIPDEIPFKTWQLYQIACSTSSLICAIGFIFCVESPKFLADKGKYEEALKVCQTIYRINTGNPRTDYPIKKLKPRMNTEKRSNLSKFLEALDLFKPPFVNMAVILFFIQTGAVGLMNILRLWLPEILSLVSSSSLDPKEGLCPLLREGNLARTNLTSGELKNQEIYFELIMVNCGSLIGHICFLITVSYIGIKIMEIGCVLAAAVISFIIPFINAEYVIVPATFSFTLYGICTFCNLSLIVFLFPTRMRATSVILVMLIARTGTFGLNFVIAKVMYNYCEYIFYGYLIYSLLMALLLLVIPKKPIEDIQRNPKGNQTPVL